MTELKPQKLMGVVLAGGQSARMGTDKAALMWGSKTWLGHAVESLRKAGCDQVWVSGDRPGYESVPDDLPSRMGPLGGVRAILRRWLDRSGENHRTRFVFVPVDMPKLDPDLLVSLITQASSQLAPISHFLNHELPIFISDPMRVLHEVEQLVSQSGNPRIWSIRELLSRFDAQVLPLSQRYQEKMSNFNFPRDLEATGSHLARSSGRPGD